MSPVSPPLALGILVAATILSTTGGFAVYEICYEPIRDLCANASGPCAEPCTIFSLIIFVAGISIATLILAPAIFAKEAEE